MAARQRGVILVITLVALVILLIGSAALIRSYDVSMLMAGNLAFKRDLVNQGERGIALAIKEFKDGGLATETARWQNLASSNYSATSLDGELGVPDALRKKTTPDIDEEKTKGVKIYYVIDRQCRDTGEYDSMKCQMSLPAKDPAGTSWIKRAGGESLPLYRISVRVQGPRGTEAYLQSTVSY
jgi:Tfp pilus assembly protein PilX